MKFIFSVVLMTIPLCVNADPVYKSVDDKGKVSYSSEMPTRATDVQEVDLLEAPTRKQVQDGQQQQERIKNEAERIGKANDKRAMEKPKKEVKEKEDEPVVVQRKSTLNDPGRQDQKPETSPPAIQPVPSPPSIQPVPSRPSIQPVRN